MQPDRYSRIWKLSSIGREGLEKLQKARITIVGLGGTGSLVADLFCRIGVSSIRLVDRDYVDESNLSRQILYGLDQKDRRKVDAAYDRLSSVNPDVRLEKRFATFDAGTGESIVSDSDICIDGTDNLTSRLILNDLCVKFDIPWIFASAIETYGQVKAIIPGKSACFACFQDNSDEGYPTCAELGVLPSIPSIISGLSYSLGVRTLLGRESGEFLYNVEADPPNLTPVRILRNDSCRSCAKRDFRYLGKEYTHLDDKPLM